MYPVIEHIVRSGAVLAPLSGVSDLAFRLIARKYGCPFAFTEMVDINAIFYSNGKTFRMLDTVPEDGLVGAQLVGSDAGRLLNAAKICRDKGFHVIDINAACPAKKVTKKDKGGILMKDPLRLAEMVRTLVKGLDIPVTVKLRAGWDPDSGNAMECAGIAEGEGASAVFIHPRYISQRYRGRPRYGIIRDIKAALSIPVIGSGNVFGPVEAGAVLAETGCDALAVARGSFGRPWIFREINSFLENGEILPPPSFAEVKRAIAEHARLSMKFKGERLTVMKMYKHLNWYLTGYPHRKRIMECYSRKVKGIDALMQLIEGLPEAEIPARGRYAGCNA